MLYKYLQLLLILTPTAIGLRLERRIVEGTEVSPKFKYPWAAAIYFRGKFHSGGVLLNKNNVLTTASYSRGPVSDYKVKIHRHNLALSEIEEKGETQDIKTILMHPQFYSEQLYPYYDLALFKLNANVTVDIGTQDIYLDDGTLSEQTGTDFKIVGWGWTSFGGKPTTSLRELQLPTVNFTECHDKWIEFGFELNSKIQLCAGGSYESAIGVAKNDEGGPLFKFVGNKVTLVGLISHYTAPMTGLPIVFSRIVSFRDFILGNL